MSSSGLLRVLHVGKFYPPHMGGMETHLEALCTGLKDSMDVGVLVANDARRTDRDSVDGISVMRAATLFNAAAAPVCPAMVSKIRRSNSDVVHIHLPNPAAILAYLASGHRGCLVFTYHSDIVRQQVLGRAFQPFLNKALKRAAAVIATSPNYVDSSPVLAAHRLRCRVIPYGIPVEKFRECDNEAVMKIRQQYGPRILISVGRLIYYKGFEYLIRAMSQVDARLLIIGDGPLRAKLERQAHESGVMERIVFLGEVHNENITPYYHAADVFVLASVARSEAFGIVQLEAMACGRPVVNTRLDSGVPFVSLDGVTGITVPPADSEALAGAINRLLDDSELRERYGQAGRRRVDAEFTVDRMVARTVELYREIVG
jgi:glycosyltransferase involved in cell wall biosynthesis